MIERHPESHDRDGDRLDAAFVEYLEAQESGDPQDRSEFLDNFPELAETLAVHDGFRRMTEPLCESMAPFCPGAVIGEYEIEERIGRGGMGTVYKVRNRYMKSIVLALKVCRFRSTDEERRRFLVEIELHAALKSPDIVPIISGGEHQGRLYFTMELMEGGDLTQATAGRPLQPHEAAKLMVNIARGVHHAHQRQILHRDLKPHNVLLDAEGRPRVADFGLSIRSDEVRSSSEAAGAPGFMSPEQTRGEATVLSDVYGLGTVLYWLLTGRQVFEGESLHDVLEMVRNEKPVPPHETNPRMAGWQNRHLESICLKCLEKEPEQRYGSAETLAVDLERWMRHEPTLHVSVRRRDRWRLWCKRTPLFAGLAVTALATLLLVVLAAGVVIRSQESALQQTMDDIKWHQDENTDVNREVGDFLEGEIRHGHPTSALQSDDSESLQRYCADVMRRIPHRNLVATVFVVDRNLTILADSEHEAAGYPVSTRDYAIRGFEDAFPDESFVPQQIYRARSDDLYKYAIVSRVRDEHGSIRALLAASIAPESSKAYKRQEDLVSQLKLWTGIVLAPLVILIVATLGFAAHRRRSEPRPN